MPGRFGNLRYGRLGGLRYDAARMARDKVTELSADGIGAQIRSGGGLRTAGPALIQRQGRSAHHYHAGIPWTSTQPKGTTLRFD